MSYYHYTNGLRLPSIVKDGIIKANRISYETNEKPTVWLTQSPKWDFACNVGVQINHNLEIEKIHESKQGGMVTATTDYMRAELGMCRIEVSENLPTSTWSEYKYLDCIPENIYDSFNDYYSRILGYSTDQWLCASNSIPKQYWNGIEMLAANQWVKWDEKISIEEFVQFCLSCNDKAYSDKKFEQLAIMDEYHTARTVIEAYKDSIVSFWITNKIKEGHVEIHLDKNDRLIEDGIKHVKKRIPKHYFQILERSVTNTYVLINFIGGSTISQVKVAVPYKNDDVYQQYVKEADFMKKYYDEIVKYWEANKHKKGYIEIYITPDYKPYKCGFKFIEKRIDKSKFMITSSSKTDTYAHVHFLWEKTFTQYKVAMAYEKVLHKEMEYQASFSN